MRSLLYFIILSKIYTFVSADVGLSSLWRSLASRNSVRALNTVHNGPFISSQSSTSRSFGEKELLVIRIEASDSSTTTSETQLIQDIFGDGLTLSKQFESCSRGNLILKPASGRYINNGVSTVRLHSVVGKTTEAVYKQINAYSIPLFGRALNQFDHVMICMPPGVMKTNEKGENTEKWHAYVPGDYEYTDYLTVYRDEWCSSVSVGMHEIGHNLGLEHANEAGVSYEDETGQMGYSGLEKDYAAMRCYNPAKSWQLGWYAAQSRRINPFIDTPFRTILTGITSDVDVEDKSKNILLQIPNGQTNFYIGYNLADGYNAGTAEGKDMVLITEQENGLRKTSELLATKDSNESYTIQNYQGSGQNLVIQVNKKLLNGKEVQLDVRFENQKHISKQNGCRDDQARFEISVKTDAYAADTSWELIDDQTKAIIAKRSNKSFKNDWSHNDLYCIDREKGYTFRIYDTHNDGICCMNGWGAYTGFLEGSEIFQGGAFRSASMSHSFQTKNVEIQSKDSNKSCRDNRKRCGWVAKNPRKRCKKKRRGKRLEKICPMTCALCNSPTVGGKTATALPTATNAPTMLAVDHHNIFCRDDPSYRFRDKRPCSWVAYDTEKRCEREWNGELVKDRCRRTCSSCS